MRAADPTLTPPELAIMKIVWRLGSVTVRDVYEALRARRRVAYTTDGDEHSGDQGLPQEGHAGSGLPIPASVNDRSILVGRRVR